MHNHLQEIIKHKQNEVAALYNYVNNNPQSKIARGYSEKTKYFRTAGFKKALLAHSKAVIAEIKRRSPSKGTLATISDPKYLAEKYIRGGVTAISVLTDAYGFNGNIQDLLDVAEIVKKSSVVILRKDFIIDPIQIAESIAIGADAILLIVAVLGDQTKSLLEYAKAHDIDAIVEVHDREELEYAIEMGAEIIGVNNRNLKTFEINVENSLNLIKHIPTDVVAIAESGIKDVEQARMFLQAGFHAVLIGEALVTCGDPEQFIKEIKRQ